jgi:hypothetical protein
MPKTEIFFLDRQDQRITDRVTGTPNVYATVAIGGLEVISAQPAIVDTGADFCVTVFALIPALVIAPLAISFIITSLHAHHFILLEDSAGEIKKVSDTNLAQIYIAAGTLIVTTVSAMSTIWIAWRGDRRQSHEFELKIQQLQLQLDETRKLKDFG